MRASEHLPERWNAAAWFVGRHVTTGRGARLVHVTDEGALDYAGLDDGVRRFAGALRPVIGRGERVALVLPDGPLFATVFWGAIAAGAIAVPISTALAPAAIAAILADCGPRVVISDVVPGAWSVVETRARLAVAAPAAYAATERDGPAFILYSSGTTGPPKGIVHRHRDMWVCAQTFGSHILDIGPDDRAFSAAKLSFAYGLGNAGYFPLAVGASSVLLAGRPAPAAVLAQIARHRPTLFFAVPTVYARLLAALDDGATADLASVRLCVSAGEALPRGLWERWRARTGHEILDGLGTTEACQTFLSARAGDVRPGSVGKAVPGFDVRVEAAPGAMGDLLVRGDSIMIGYWNRPDATREALDGDWLRTGDKVIVDEDGHHFYAGRSDDLFKVSGHWVVPAAVEAVLAEHPAVLECAVVERKDPDGLSVAHAVVALRAGAAEADEELRALAEARLAPHERPHSLSFIAELPRTATGKVQRYLLR